jgi:outer membrane lipoprotein-sorting protein
MNKNRLWLFVLVVWAVSIASMGMRVAAQGGADEGRRIVDEWEKRSTSNSYRYEGQLQTVDENGHTTDKSWTLERLGSHGQAKVVIAFKAPAEVKGVALLIVNHPDRASDQWMWTPAIERDRRIAIQDRSTRFFGTDFSFEDLEERDVDQFDYQLLGEQKVEGAVCWKIQSVPKQAKSSQYTKQVVYVRKDNYAFARIESFVKDLIVRRLNYSNIVNIQNIWTAKSLAVSDVKRGSLTRLTLEKVEYNIPLADDRFTVQSLRNR